MSCECPILSVIVTSFTAERCVDVFEALDSIHRQTVFERNRASNTEASDPKAERSILEVIFVAEKSVELYNKVIEYGGRIGLENLRVLWNSGAHGANQARNLGIANARGEIIAFIDDDVVLFPQWAEQMIKTYEDERVIGVTGPALPLWEDPSMAWVPEEFHWIVSCTSWFKRNDKSDVRNVWLENASFRKEAFSLAGYFDPNLGPQDSAGEFKQREFGEGILSEEVEFSMRVRNVTGKRIVYNPDVRVYHKVQRRRLRWSYIAKWSYWTGYSKRKLRKRATASDSAHGDLLNSEYQLLGRIVRKLLPEIMMSLVCNPSVGWRKARMTFVVLFFVTAGYLSLPLARRVLSH